MAYDWTLHVSVFLIIWSALIAGEFSAFSEFIMRGLQRAAPAAGIEAMQQINRTVLRTQFVFGIIAIAPVSIGVAVHAVQALDGAPRFALAAAAVVYVSSVFLVTVLGNVPMNNRLARLDHHSDEAVRYWRVYGRDWTRLNTIRTLGSLATAILYLTAVIATVAGA